MKLLLKRIALLVMGKGRKRHTNLYRGTVVALVPVTVFVLVCAGLFSGPQTRELSLQDWAKTMPSDFVLTAARELADASDKESSGPPYNLLSKGESLGPIDPQNHTGLGVPIDPAQDFVIGPLQMSQQVGSYAAIARIKGLNSKAQTEIIQSYVESQGTQIGSAIGQWTAADTGQQRKWANAYISVLKSSGSREHIVDSPAFGPVMTLTSTLLFIAQAGTLDGILTTKYSTYPTDFTQPALFLNDGHYVVRQAQGAFLDGQRMAVASGTYSYPGQFWLTPYAFWYSIKPFSSSKNADIDVFAILLIISLGTLYYPKIPILNKLPLLLPFRKLREERLH